MRSYKLTPDEIRGTSVIRVTPDEHAILTNGLLREITAQIAERKEIEENRNELLREANKVNAEIRDMIKSVLPDLERIRRLFP